MINAEARKRIERLLEHIVPSSLEEKKRVVPSYQPVTQVFAEYLHRLEYRYVPGNPECSLPPLTPQEIQEFLQLTIPFDNQTNDGIPSDIITGLFLRDLLKQSYQAGYNNFIIPLHGRTLYFCRNLKADARNRCRITIEGDIEAGFGERCKGIDFIINGKIKDNTHTEHWLGEYSSDCRFVLHQEINKMYCKGTQRCEFTFTETIPDFGTLDEPRDCIFLFQKEVNYFNPCITYDGAKPQNCTFIFHDKSTMKRFVDCIEHRGYSNNHVLDENKVIFTGE